MQDMSYSWLLHCTSIQYGYKTCFICFGYGMLGFLRRRLPLSLSEHSKFCLERMCFCAFQRQATRVLWLSHLHGVEAAFVVFLFLVRQLILATELKRVLRGGAHWSTDDVCGGGLSDHWSSHSWEWVNLPHWFAHWGASTRKCNEYQQTKQIFFSCISSSMLLGKVP